MKPPPSRLRRTTRWCGRGMLLGCLVLGYIFVHLNQIGLPDFVKNPLLAQLRGHGLNLDFSRLRLRLTRGIIADNVRLVRETENTGEQVQVEQVQLKLNYPALLSGKLEIVALRIRDGGLSIPMAAPGEEPYLLKVEDVQMILRFAGTNHWVLESLQGHIHGAQLHASGTLTNILAFKRPTSERPPPTGSWKQPVLRWVRGFDRMQFAQAPKVDLEFLADAANPAGSRARVRIEAGGLETEYGTLAGMEFEASARQRVGGTDEGIQVDARLKAARAATKWGGASEVLLTVAADQPLTHQPPRAATWDLTVRQLTNQWGRVERLVLQGESKPHAGGETLGTGDLAMLMTQWTLRAESVETEKGRLTALGMRGEAEHSWKRWSKAKVSIHVASPTTAWGDGEGLVLDLSAEPVPPGEARPEWGFWNAVRGVEMNGVLRVTNIVSPRLQVDSAAIVVGWKAPRLELISLQAALCGGRGEVTGELDIGTRRAVVRLRENLDLHALAPMLTPAANQWLGQYSWKGRSPVATAELGVRLPAWTNRQPDWRGEVMPSLTIAGDFSASQVSFRGVLAGDASGEFTLTNASWYIPRVVIQRPEGSLQFAYRGDMRTHDYRFTLRSTIDPTIAKPLLDDEKAQKAFDQFSLGSPPLIEGDIWGRWMERERTGFQVRVTATNAVVRGERCDYADGHVGFTNAVLTFKDVTLRQGSGMAKIPGAAYAVSDYLLSFTNAVSTLSAESVTRVIGPKTAALIAPYHFLEPPHAVVNGVIGTRNELPTDVTFEIDGGRFEWLRLRAETARGRIHWVGQTLQISNLVAACYGGRLKGDLNFDLKPDKGSIFNFGLAITNIDLRRFMADVSDRTNKLEGLVSGVLNLDRAHSWDTNSYHGHGQLNLREGFLWDTPAFGVFSPIFEGISPGLGQTRFSSGEAHFVATNSVFRTDDLEVRSSTVRLRYTGTVGLDTRLDARMEAELLKDLPVLGPMLSAALSPFTKLFEYRVRGTLAAPIAEPLYVPKLLLVPLHPLKTLRDLFLPSEKKSAPSNPTNSSTLPQAPPLK